MLKRLRSVALFEDIFTLSLGSAIAQALAVLISPILTRLYTPADYGLFGSFSAIVTIISMVATLKYEQAVSLEKEESGAISIVGVCFALAIVTSVLAAVGFFVAAISESSRMPEGFGSLLLAFGAPSILVAALFNPLQFLGLRRRIYLSLAAFQVAKSAGMAVFQISLALAGFAAWGLVAGQWLATALALLIVMIPLRHDLMAAVRQLPHVGLLWSAAARHPTLPRYGAPQTFVSGVATNIPTYLLTYLFGPTEAGWFWMSYRLLVLPNVVLIENIRSVLFQRMATLKNNGQSLRPITFKASLALLVACLLITAFLFAFGETLFVWVFGPQWGTAGTYIAILAVGWAFQNAAVPSAAVTVVVGRQKEQLIMEIVSAAARIGALIAGGMMHDATMALSLYAGASLLASVAYMGFVWRILP
ncbi:oligosaccharide flippase family protein [Oryzibacter oryziterrae]|uniref:oligosaccharide flippase family protein n=1 Tax=Oryzibacter oryziterrae TaxID=2766474 RepID=UPI001F488511|nr:oligosaccharide flippase family protein [Oryzibacter oryziterrae]